MGEKVVHQRQRRYDWYKYVQQLDQGNDNHDDDQWGIQEKHKGENEIVIYGHYRDEDAGNTDTQELWEGCNKETYHAKPKREKKNSRTW